MIQALIHQCTSHHMHTCITTMLLTVGRYIIILISEREREGGAQTTAPLRTFAPPPPASLPKAGLARNLGKFLKSW